MRRATTRQDVLEAARDILDEGGLETLTMATVANRVGFTTMAVYRHVRNRDDLVEAVVDLVLRDIAEKEVDDVDWLDGVETWMHDVRTHLLAHPWVGGLLGTRAGPSPPWQATVRALSHHLTRSGVSSRDQARALQWVTRVTIGILIQELGAPITGVRHAFPSSVRDPLVKELRRLTDDDLFTDVVTQTRGYLTSLAPARAAGRTRSV